MKTKDLVLNFVRQFKKPFTAETVVSMIAQDTSAVEPVLLELLADKTIKLISKKEGIYVLADRYSPGVCYKLKGDWKFEISAAAALLDQIGKGQYTSIRAVADDFGKSRQWVFVYMEALASIGCIGMEGKHYRVLRTDNLRSIGKKIEPGILGRMRPKVSEEEKRKRAKERKIRRQELVRKAAAREQALTPIKKRELVYIEWNKYRKSQGSWHMNFRAYLKKQGLE